jgi:hypothetical protein
VGGCVTLAQLMGALRHARVPSGSQAAFEAMSQHIGRIAGKATPAHLGVPASLASMRGTCSAEPQRTSCGAAGRLPAAPACSQAGAAGPWRGLWLRPVSCVNQVWHSKALKPSTLPCMCMAAGHHVRSAATVGGHFGLAKARPLQSDLATVMMAAGAQLQVGNS